MNIKELLETLNHYHEKYGDDLPVQILDIKDDDEDGACGMYPVQLEVVSMHPVVDGELNEDEDVPVLCFEFENRYLD